MSTLLPRLLAIDFGLARIGLAISDPGAHMALPLGTFTRGDDRAAARKIAALAQREGVTGFVVGEPRRLDGSRGEAAQRVTQFADRLAALTGLPIQLVDESLTSVEAARRLRAAGIDPSRHPERVDAVAAQILLEEALDRQRGLAAGAKETVP